MWTGASEPADGWLLLELGKLELEKFRLSASDHCWPATVIDLNIISSLRAGQNHLLEEEGDLMAAESDAVIEWGVKLVNINILAMQFVCLHRQQTGQIEMHNIGEKHLARAVERILGQVTPFDSNIIGKRILHYFLVWPILMPGRKYERIQLNVQCIITEDEVFPNVNANTHDMILTTAEIWPILDLAIIAEDKPMVGQLMTVLTTAGLDTIQMGSNCAACRHWVFHALKVFADACLIRDNWQWLASQWNDDVVRVAGEQGAGVMEEDILLLGDWVGFIDSLHYGSATNFLPALRKFFHHTYERLYTLL
ncbi:hypothetical protein F5146DRAFT_1001867 [Armillaria mellea]|nr:hypothetical protein F5146DRAFT_1001867 [Armillaria mellea]